MLGLIQKNKFGEKFRRNFIAGIMGFLFILSFSFSSVSCSQNSPSNDNSTNSSSQISYSPIENLIMSRYTNSQDYCIYEYTNIVSNNQSIQSWSSNITVPFTGYFFMIDLMPMANWSIIFWNSPSGASTGPAASGPSGSTSTTSWPRGWCRTTGRGSVTTGRPRRGRSATSGRRSST